MQVQGGLELCETKVSHDEGRPGAESKTAREASLVKGKDRNTKEQMDKPGRTPDYVELKIDESKDMHTKF